MTKLPATVPSVAAQHASRLDPSPYDDAFSNASDDDMKAVEVSFDASNPYRRKSSLVNNDITRPRMPASKKSHCLVHQFLEGHRRGHDHDPASHNGAQDKIVEPKGERSGSKLSIVESDGAETPDAGQVDEKSWRASLSKTRSELDLQAEDHELHSRLLTKKQLSEMAWGVRELSRRLGSVRLKFQAKSIFILTKVFDIDLLPKTREIAKWLLSADRDTHYTIWLQDALKDNRRFDLKGLVAELRREYVAAGKLDADAPNDALEQRIRFWNEEMCRSRPHTFDFIITLGGDGTVLYASWLFQRIVPPVLSFALGSLGFLTKFDFTEYQSILGYAFKEGVSVSLRLRFEGTIMRCQRKQRPLANGDDLDEEEAHRARDLVEELVGEEKEDEHTHRPDGTYEILNEIVIDRGPNPSKLWHDQAKSMG